MLNDKRDLGFENNSPDRYNIYKFSIVNYNTGFVNIDQDKN